MAQSLVKTIADFSTTLVTKTAVGATSATLTSGIDQDGIQLPTGTYGFTIDRKNSAKEHFTATLTGAELTDIKTVTRGTGLGTAGLLRVHRKGAEVIITDHVSIKRMMNILDGTTSLDASTPLGYDGTVTISTDNQIATKAYVDGVAIAGAADASTGTKGISKLSTSPVSPTDPIAVGDNDTRVPTQDENNALVGTSGTPSTSNKYVTNDDTDGTGDIVRTSLLTSYIAGKQNFVAGQALTADDALHISQYSQSDGGITLDVQTATTYSSTTNQSMSFTVASNSNRLLLVGVVTSSLPTTVTYNAVTMTLIDSQALPSGGNTLYVYRLVAPSTGANNITVTGSGINGISGASYYNVDQTTPVDATQKSNASASSITHTLTSISSASFLHSFFTIDGLSGITSITTTADSKYQKSVSATVVKTVNGSAPMLSTSTIGKVNEAQAIPITSSQGGGSGSPVNAMISLGIKAATAPSVGVVKTNASAITFNEPLIEFIGFADSSVAAGATVSVTYGGIYNSLSGLTAGSRYFLSDTPGAISTTTGTYSKIIGKAYSATDFIIDTQKTVTSTPISKAINSTYTAETDGFAYIQNGSGTATIVTGGVTYTSTTTGGEVIPLTIPVARGNTYVFSNSGTNHKFIPLA